jgi:hypothetical protein
MGWACVLDGKTKKADRELVRKPVEKRSFGRQRRRRGILSQDVTLFNYQLHTPSYITRVILPTSFGSENEPSSGH